MYTAKLCRVWSLVCAFLDAPPMMMGVWLMRALLWGHIWVLYSHLPKREIVETVSFLVEAVTTCR